MATRRRFFHWLSLSTAPIEGRVLDAHLSEITPDDLPRIPPEYWGTWYGPFDVGPNGQITRASGTTPVTPSGMPSRVFTHSGTAGSVGTTETDLYSDTLSAGFFAANDDAINFVYGGAFTSLLNASQTVRVYFDGNKIFDSGAIAVTVLGSWTIEADILRVSATVIRYRIAMVLGATSAKTGYGSVGELTSLTLANAVILKVTGQSAGVGAADNDITANMSYATKFPA